MVVGDTPRDSEGVRARTHLGRVLQDSDCPYEVRTHLLLLLLSRKGVSDLYPSPCVTPPHPFFFCPLPRHDVSLREETGEGENYPLSLDVICFFLFYRGLHPKSLVNHILLLTSGLYFSLNEFRHVVPSVAVPVLTLGRRWVGRDTPEREVECRSLDRVGS